MESKRRTSDAVSELPLLAGFRRSRMASRKRRPAHWCAYVGIFFDRSLAFSRASGRRVLLTVKVCHTFSHLTSSHLHIFTFSFFLSLSLSPLSLSPFLSFSFFFSLCRGQCRRAVTKRQRFRTKRGSIVKSCSKIAILRLCALCLEGSACKSVCV